jgi:hypothetical protein
VQVPSDVVVQLAVEPLSKTLAEAPFWSTAANDTVLAFRGLPPESLAVAVRLANLPEPTWIEVVSARTEDS